MNIDFSEYFEKDDDTYKEKGITIYQFKNELLDNFISDFVVEFRRAYISDNRLKNEIDNQLWDRKRAIESRLPTKPNLKSGEFAEILLFCLAQCFICPDVTITPIKWRWKENQDQPCHLTDIILAKRNDEEEFLPDDYIFLIESKAAATPLGPNSANSVVNDGITDLKKDLYSRTAKTITYLITHFSNAGKIETAKKVRRFEFSVEYPYKRIFNSAIVVDAESVKKHIDNISEDNLIFVRDNNISLLVVPIARMKTVYERLYADVTES